MSIAKCKYFDALGFKEHTAITEGAKLDLWYDDNTDKFVNITYQFYMKGYI